LAINDKFRSRSDIRCALLRGAGKNFVFLLAQRSNAQRMCERTFILA